MEEKRERLLNLLVERSYMYSPDKLFKLVSGKESPYYVNCKPVTNNAEGMTLIGEIIFEMIREMDVEVIGGMTMGADPIAHAVSIVSFQKGKPIHSFSVRKQAKDHGIVRKQGLDGDVKPGQKAVVLDDVITTGGSTIQAIDAVEAFGLEVVRIIVLVDREEGGNQNIKERIPGVEVQPVFTIAQLQACSEAKGP